MSIHFFNLADSFYMTGFFRQQEQEEAKIKCLFQSNRAHFDNKSVFGHIIGSTWHRQRNKNDNLL